MFVRLFEHHDGTRTLEWHDKMCSSQPTSDTYVSLRLRRISPNISPSSLSPSKTFCKSDIVLLRFSFFSCFANCFRWRQASSRAWRVSCLVVDATTFPLPVQENQNLAHEVASNTCSTWHITNQLTVLTHRQLASCRRRRRRLGMGWFTCWNRSWTSRPTRQGSFLGSWWKRLPHYVPFWSTMMRSLSKWTMMQGHLSTRSIASELRLCMRDPSKMTASLSDCWWGSVAFVGRY